MDDNHYGRGFRLPESFLTQLEEYTQGYMLVVCNENGDIYSHEAYDNAVIKLGLMSYADIHVTAALTHMRNSALKEEQNLSDFHETLGKEDEENNEEDDDESDIDFL